MGKRKSWVAFSGYCGIMKMEYKNKEDSSNV